MSGGSHNYLCYKDSSDIGQSISDLEIMRDRLIELDHKEAAKETESIILIIQSFEVRVGVRIERLSEVWKAVEWYDSCDCGIEAIQEAIKKYNND